ncbi:MAG: PadR family transcriptional regulator [Vicinamibacterales bacterium]
MPRERSPFIDTTASALSDLAFHILLALGSGPSHGYAIGKSVEEQSEGRLDPTTGALYQAIRRLTEDGLIAPVEAPDDTDPRRKYFALTRSGRQAVASEARRLEALVRAARDRKLYPQRA